jgi:hypothetical protein
MGAGHSQNVPYDFGCKVLSKAPSLGNVPAIGLYLVPYKYKRVWLAEEGISVSTVGNT